MAKRYKHPNGQRTLKFGVPVGLKTHLPMRDRKAQLFALFNPLSIIVISIVAFLILGLFVGFAVFLAFNVFTMIGALLLVLSAIAVFKGHANQYILGMGFVGFLLIAIPHFTDALSGFTLSAVLPK